MRLLVLSLEFSVGTFSGNGIYCCSQASGSREVRDAKGGGAAVIAHPPTAQVRALRALGHEVLVIHGCPPGQASESGEDGAVQVRARRRRRRGGALRLSAATWGTRALARPPTPPPHPHPHT